MSTLTKLGRYTVLRKLAAGGMGEVFAARQEGIAGFEKIVVLKTLRAELAEKPEFREMFFEEARVSALARHANVVSVLDVGLHDGTYYIVMEYIEGWSLRQVLEARAKLPLAHAITIAIDMACGLHHVHSLRDPDDRPLALVHRDVSPENVMIAVDGQSKLVDFGIAKRQGSPIETDPGVLKGKARYLAPEQVRGEQVTPATDQFSLASVLFEMCTGEPLFLEKSTAEVVYAMGSGNIRRPTDVCPDLPDEVLSLLERALSREPPRRFPSCDDVTDELIRIQETLNLRDTRADLVNFLHQHVPRDRPRKQRGGEHTTVVTPVGADRQIGRDDTMIRVVDTGLIGRAHELGELASHLSGGARLVTLLGPGGIGKTSLARHYAQLQRYQPGAREVYFCDLTDCRSQSDIGYLVAGQIGVPLTSETSWGDAALHIGRALAGRGPTLLILDNAEQLIDKVAESVDRWLNMAPELAFVVTSREPLNLADELRLDVAPLSRDEAVELLCHRIGGVRPGWSPTADEREVAETIVEQLDRLPLAIELAAGRGAVMSMTQLSRRLTSGLGFLRNQRRGVTGRHASLVDTIAWSWQLLTAPERHALAQCSVFRGGFTLSAAEQVLALSGGEHGDDSDVIDVIQSLREKSLLYADARDDEPTDELRFRMYESIRSFAKHKLGRDRAAVRARHLAYFLAQAETLAGAVDGPDGAEKLGQMAIWLDNFQVALDTAHEVSAEHAARLALAVDRLLASRGPARRHQDWLEIGLKAARSSGRHRDAARLLVARGRALTLRGEQAAARSDLQAAIELAEALEHPELVASACESFGFHHLRRRAVDQSWPYYQRAYDLYRQLDRPDDLARVLGQIALYHQRSGNFDDAGACFDQAIELHREHGNVWAAFQLHGRRGLYLLERGRFADARRDLHRSITVARQWGDVSREATDYCNLGFLEMEAGNRDTAKNYLREALRIDLRQGNRPSQAIVRINLGVLALDSKHLDDAENHFREALAIARDVQYPHLELMAVGNLGIAAQVRGNIQNARSHLDQCREMQARHPASWTPPSVFLAHLGSVLATLGDLDGARATFDACRARIAAGNHPHYQSLVHCLEGLCDLMLAQRAASNAEVALLIDRARSRLDTDATTNCDLRIAQYILRESVQGAIDILGGETERGY